jgi:hypothetical protein
MGIEKQEVKVEGSHGRKMQLPQRHRDKQTAKLPEAQPKQQKEQVQN